MPTINATVYPDEAYVLVEADWSGTILRDNFNRTVTDDWGAATTGQDWSPAGAAYDVNGTRGTFTHTAAGTTLTQLAAVSALDVDMSGKLYNTVTPVGGNFDVSFLARYVDANNFVDARLFISTTGSVTAAVRQMVGGVETSSSSLVVPGVNAADAFGWRLWVQGNQIRFRAWKLGTQEPTQWLVGLTTTWLTAGQVGLGSFINGAATNPMPVVFMFDDLVVTDSNTVAPAYGSVTRRNTVTGEIVTLRPYIGYDTEGNLLLDCGQGLWWDTEPPLNVPLEYCAHTPTASTNLVTNCCFEGGTSPWEVYFSSGALAASATFAHEGLQSARFTPTGTFVGPRFSQIITGGFEGTSPVTMSAWALSPQGWNGVWLQLDVTYLNGVVVTYSSPVEVLERSRWRHVSFTFNPTQEITSAVLYFRMGGVPPAATLFYVDEVSVVQADSGGITTSACETVTVTSSSVWLKSPLHPCDDIQVGLCSPVVSDCGADDRVSYVGHDDDTYEANTALLSGPNRRRPVPMGRVRRDAQSTLRVLAHDCEARAAVLAANLTGDPLLFQAPATYCIPDRYISVGAVGETRISADQREDFRLMTMPYVTTDRPIGPSDGVCGARIADLCDIYTSWAALGIAGLTWNDLLLGQASPNGPGQPDPPAGARTWLQVETQFANWSAVEAEGTWADIRDGT